MTDAAEKVAAIDAHAWSDEEVDAVAAAFACADPWKHTSDDLAHVSAHLAQIKAKLAALHLKLQGNKCCYCRTLLNGGGPFLIDREHILPKGKYRELTYDPINLSVSCKRCNMEYKRQKVTFVVDPITILEGYKECTRYLFVHPNLDTWRLHLHRFVVQLEEKEIVKYTIEPGSEKGAYSHKFFNLAGLEVDTFNQAQGEAAISGIQETLRDILEQDT